MRRQLVHGQLDEQVRDAPQHRHAGEQRPGAAGHPTNALTENVAPPGSASTAPRSGVGGRSAGGATIEPPRSSARVRRCVGIVDPEVHVPGGRAVGGHHHGHHVTRHGLAGLTADISGKAEQRHRPPCLRDPAEHRLVERAGGLGVGSLQRAVGPGVRLVDDLRALAGIRLPHAQLCARAGRRPPPGGPPAVRRRDRRSPIRPRLAWPGRAIGVLDADVGEPGLPSRRGSAVGRCRPHRARAAGRPRTPGLRRTPSRTTRSRSAAPPRGRPGCSRPSRARPPGRCLVRSFGRS